jgi:hypothetical protein
LNAQCVPIFLCSAMEDWRKELREAIERKLDESDDDSDRELEVFWDLLESLEEDSFSPPPKKKRGGSIPGRRYVFREREVCHQRLVNDYFADTPTFDVATFRRRFQMRRPLFLGIVERICRFDLWFVQCPDALGRLGLSSLQKCTAAIQMLAYSVWELRHAFANALRAPHQ